MRFASLVIMVIFALTARAVARDIHGSGSTIVFPVMTQWLEAYGKAGGGHVQYQPIGSANGITEIGHDVVDFAMSEAPLDDARLLRDGLVQFPLVIDAIVPVVNIPGIAPGQLRLTGPVLADIYLGKLTKWNDPAIAMQNPDSRLPDMSILVIHRSDGSGSSFIWSDYLSKMSTSWKAQAGVGTRIGWPAGVGVKHNGGVVDAIRRFPGAIGYVDYPSAADGKLAHARVQNEAGVFVVPGMEAFLAATADVDWMPERDFEVSLTDAKGADAWPIMGISFAVMHRSASDPARARDVLAFFRWALINGGDLARARFYLPLPPVLIEQVTRYWETEGR